MAKELMNDIREWYKEKYGNLQDEVTDGYDVCDAIWFYVKSHDKKVLQLSDLCDMVSEQENMKKLWKDSKDEQIRLLQWALRTIHAYIVKESKCAKIAHTVKSR